MTTLDLTLGRGLVDTAGDRHRSAVLAAPDGWLEAYLADEVDLPPGPAAVEPAVRHRVLATCLERVGGYQEPSEALVGSLTRGDLHQIGYGVHAAMLGDHVPLVVRCPNPACGELADVDVDLAELLADTATPEPEWFRAEADGGAVVLRTPSSADLAEVAGLPEPDRTAALMATVIRTVEVGGAPAPVDWPALDAPLRAAALTALATGLVAPTTDLQIGCPTCRAVMEVRLDPLVLLARRLRAGGGRLLVETHCLAYHYGWSEDAVLALPRERRWAYLALLRAQLTGAPLETAVGRG